MRYRREIDGLRAIAVLPVILFHAGFKAFSGGFVGVDVFFVISGYLITSIILIEIEQSRFSLLNFYERRARRILPALFCVMLVCIPFAWVWLRPSDLKDFSQSLAAVSVFSSNVLFWIESGYFEVWAGLKPLLHTWSLSVEEQYYVVFPLFLWMVVPLGKRRTLLAIAIIGLISLALAQWGAQIDPEAAFFLLPSRAWELMIGAAAAFLCLHERELLDAIEKQTSVPEGLGLVGLGLVLYAVTTFDETIPYPSIYALLPTLGTALIILFANAQTIVGRLLGHRALVGIGLISYSAYLWHQPLFAFVRQRHLRQPSDGTYIALSLLALLLAYFSWRYIEMPFRRKGAFGRPQIFALATVGSIFFIGIGTLGHVVHRADAEETKLSRELESRIRINYGLDGTCQGGASFSEVCRTSDNPEIVVWGDSYAMHLVAGILSANPDAKLAQLTLSVCGPFFSLSPVDRRHPKAWAETCNSFTDHVRAWLWSHRSVKYVVLSSPFFQYLDDDARVLVDGTVRDATPENAIRAFRETLEELRRMGIRPVIFSPPPQSEFNIGSCLVKATFFAANLDSCNFRTDELTAKNLLAYKFLRSFAHEYRVIWLNEFICQDDLCLSHMDQHFLYQDRGHLSYEGSALLGTKFDFYKLITSEQL